MPSWPRRSGGTSRSIRRRWTRWPTVQTLSVLAERFIAELRDHSFGVFSGVPCSYLTPFMNALTAADGVAYVGAANEGDAVAIAAGTQLGGYPGVAMFQNSGLGNAVSPLTSLTRPFRLPVLIITTWRGQPDGTPDEVQHEFMGSITPQLLELMNIPWEPFPASEADVPGVVARATVHMQRTGQPYGLILSEGTVPKSPVVPSEVITHGAGTATGQASVPLAADDALRAVQSVTSGDVVIATTGYTGRGLYALDDRPNQLYMVGSMGCAPSLGLGLALVRPDLRIVVLDGDGAALMRLGAYATIGRERPPNLVHVLLDNGIHESTGGQPTVGSHVDFPAVARASGYPVVHSVASPAELAAAVESGGTGLSFVYARTAPRPSGKLPRPSIGPVDVAARLRSWMAS
ncbi:MAG: phosphonopyruvate decarboxylase [Acidimicrobiia bacterium]|nr:phosphonopyruvate decarboxylase [Acidimicrobiia bacterium]